jgi:biofilm PGA synthesis N-glycosyltransferase PgaC
MEAFIDEYFNFIASLSSERFVRIFWFFVMFELVRYVVLDFTFLLSYRLSLIVNKKKIRDAKERFYFEQPFLSLIIPGKNEGEHLCNLINSLQQQTYKKFEIIVIDDGSDDNTPIIGRSLEKARLIDVFLRNEVRGGKASAANLALRFSKGKYIIHLDADCSFDSDAIENIILPFYMDSKVGAVGGNVMVRNYKKSLATTMQAMEYYDTISVGRIVSSYLGIYRVISGAFGAFRKDVIEEIKGWDIGPGLDGDITVKVRKAGYSIKFAPDAVCLTNAPDTFRKLAKQRMRWDKSLVRFRMRKHKDVFFPNQAFNWSNFLSFAENIFYGFILNFKWLFYIIDVLYFHFSQAKFIVLTNLFLYIFMNFFKFLVFSLFRKRKNAPVVYFIPYIPLLIFYFGYFLRLVRLFAHTKELFLKASYDDPWNPLKTSKHAKRLGL